jgi:hypothetical protein
LTSAKAEWFRDDLQSYLYSPIKSSYVTNSQLGLNPAGLTYYVLVVLGLVSFFAAGPAWSWWRLLIWLVFALLSLTLARAIPFFAVVGGVIAALNWQDFAVQRFGVQPSLDPRRKNWALLGRTLTFVVGLVLLVLAWPGWLNARPEQPRQVHRNHRVAWTIDVDASLRAAALKLAELRANKVLTEEDHGFNFAPEVANYCAWFCPQEKDFIDYRFQLFQDNLSTFTNVREALTRSPDSVASTDTDWPRVFRERGISHVIVYSSGDALLRMRPFWALPYRWAMLYADGRTAVFGWIDPDNSAKARRWRGHEVNLNQLAFGPNRKPDDRLPEEALEPEKNPDVPQPVSWWTQYATGPPPRSPALDEAAMYRTWFDDTLRRYHLVAERLSNLVMNTREAFLRLGPGYMVLQSMPRQLAAQRERLELRDRLLYTQNRMPSPALMLAVRAARRALDANANDTDAYRELGLAYWLQFENYERRYQYPSLQQLRQIQIITAFQNARTLQPDSPTVHKHLALMYGQMFVEPLLFNVTHVQPQVSFIDLEIEHLQEWANLIRAAGPQLVIRGDGAEPSKETADEFSKRIEGLERDVKQREKAVDLQRRRNDYEVTTANKPPIEKIKRALELGLVKQALDVLKEPVDLSEDGKELVIRLYLATGEVQLLLDPEKTSIANPWNNFFLRAAVGDYRQAESYLGQIVRSQEPLSIRNLLVDIRAQAFQAGLHPLALAEMVRTPFAFAGQANDWVLWGLLALEEGATDKAAERFRKAIEMGVWPQYRAIVLTPLAAGSPWEALVLHLETSITRQRSSGPTVPFATRLLAYGYLQLLREAGHSQ